MKLILLVLASALAQTSCSTTNGVVCCTIDDSMVHCTSVDSESYGLPSFTYSTPGNSATTRATSSNGVQVMVCEAGGGGCWDQGISVSQHSGRSYTTITQTFGATQDDDDDDVSSARATGSASNADTSNAGTSNAGSSAARSSAAVDSNRAAIVSVCGGVLAMVFANLL